MIPMNLPNYRKLVKVSSLQFRDKLRVFLKEEGYRAKDTYQFTQKEIESITGIKVAWWGNWKYQSIPAHIFLLLHLNFDVDLNEFFSTGELKKNSRGGRENECA